MAPDNGNLRGRVLGAVLIIIDDRELRRQRFLAWLEPDFAEELGLTRSRVLVADQFEHSQEHANQGRPFARPGEKIEEGDAAFVRKSVANALHVHVDRRFVVANVFQAAGGGAGLQNASKGTDQVPQLHFLDRLFVEFSLASQLVARATRIAFTPLAAALLQHAGRVAILFEFEQPADNLLPRVVERFFDLVLGRQNGSRFDLDERAGELQKIADRVDVNLLQDVEE